jgi:hypothetical protein
VRRIISTPNDFAALRALSNPPARPVLMFQVATVKVPIPSVPDGTSTTSSTMPTAWSVLRDVKKADLRV